MDYSDGSLERGQEGQSPRADTVTRRMLFNVGGSGDAQELQAASRKWNSRSEFHGDTSGSTINE